MEGRMVSTSSASLRTLSLWAYVLTFGALWGYSLNRTGIANGSTGTGALFVWVVMALVGSSLIGVKNHRITDKRVRTRITVGDGAAIGAGLVLIIALPDFLGLIKGLALLVLVTPYVLWYFRTLERLQAS